MKSICYSYLFALFEYLRAADCIRLYFFCPLHALAASNLHIPSIPREVLAAFCLYSFRPLHALAASILCIPLVIFWKLAAPVYVLLHIILKHPARIIRAVAAGCKPPVPTAFPERAFPAKYQYILRSASRTAKVCKRYVPSEFLFIEFSELLPQSTVFMLGRGKCNAPGTIMPAAA